MEGGPLLLPAPEPSLSDQFGSLAQAIGLVQQSLEQSEQQQGTETGHVLLGRQTSKSRAEQLKPAARQGTLSQKPVPEKAVPLPVAPSSQQKDRLPNEVRAAPKDAALTEKAVEAVSSQVQPDGVQDRAGALKNLEQAKELQAAEADPGLRGSEAQEVGKDVSDAPSGRSGPMAQHSLAELRQRAVAAVKLRRAEGAKSASSKRSAQPQSSESMQLEKAQEAILQKDLASEAAGQQAQGQAQLQQSKNVIPSPDVSPKKVTENASHERDAVLLPEAHEDQAHDAAQERPARNFRQRKAVSSVSGSLISSRPPDVTASPQSRPNQAVAPASTAHQPPSKRQRLEEQTLPPGLLPMPPNFPLPNLTATSGDPSSSDTDSPPPSRSHSRRRSEKRERSSERRESRDRSRRSTYGLKPTYKERAKERERERERDWERRRREESRRRNATSPRHSSRCRSPAPNRQRRSRSRKAYTPDHNRRNKRARTRSPRAPSAKAQHITRTTPGERGSLFCNILRSQESSSDPPPNLPRN